MKKHLPILVILLLSCFVAQGQIKVGVKGGLNVSTFSYEPPTGFDDLDIGALAGFHLGGFVNFGINDNWGVQGELMYSNQGGTITRTDISTGQSIEIEARRRLNYLSLPALMKYHSNSGVTFEAGPVFDFLLRGNESYDVNVDLAGFAIDDENVTDDHLGVDVKLAVGAGYEVASGLSFNLRYSFSLSSTLDEDGENFLEGEEASINLFQLSAGFPLYAR